jgi:hypothetical protein
MYYDIVEVTVIETGFKPGKVIESWKDGAEKA